MAKPTSGITDIATLQMALVGFELEKKRIEGKIQEIQAALAGRKQPAPAPVAAAGAPKRVLSPAARRRIAAAQKKRWAEHRRKKKAAAAAEAK
jgi:hypothetical protein